ncbi:PLP-dependent transferase [Flagelloscypha sp. PMI_526]|nr:PLP-dependent transferase [Flagelloscypha sp. PMI_526]
MLFRNLHVLQIFGANTNVGKTLLTIALCRAAAKASRDVFYLKPISTGSPEESDQTTVTRHAKNVKSTCLYQFDHPVSPHLAAKLAGSERLIPSDDTVVNSISSYLKSCADNSSVRSHVFVETAGGVHSPSLQGTSQLDLYRPLLLPTILVGDAKLGGISSTISAYESMMLRGYTVDLVLLFQDEYYRNFEYLSSYFANEHGISVRSFPSPPAILPDPNENFSSTETYFDTIEPEMTSAIDTLDKIQERRLEELGTMGKRALDSVWWPFVQHGLVQSEKDVSIIDSAHSDFFNVLSSPNKQSVLEPQFDGSASWWTQSFGHAHPALTFAAARASGRYALRLSETLLNDGPGKGWASRVFFSDDGSTGMEVALKMALRSYSTSNNLDKIDRKRLGVLGLKGSYHGDTIGTMDATEDNSVYTCEWHNAKGYWLDTPTVGFRNGKTVVRLPRSLHAIGAHETVFSSPQDVYDVESRLDSPLAFSYRRYLNALLIDLQNSPSYLPIATLVLEPLVMGAGGMIFVDPLYQHILISTTRELLPNVPVIFDEVFVGLYRLGFMSSTSILRTNPDISVNAKILTGGLLPMSVTLANEKIFEAFKSDKKADALLHGHSYTGNPIGCEVANETMKLIEREIQTNKDWETAKSQWNGSTETEREGVWSLWDVEFVKALSELPVVEEVMALGTVLAFKISGDGSAELSPGGMPFSVHYRTLGDVAYFVTSLNTRSEVIRELEEKIWNALNDVRDDRPR